MLQKLKKYTNKILTAAGILLSLTFMACSDEDLWDEVQDPVVEEGEFSITTGLSQTRAEEGHINTNDPYAGQNEDLISSAEIYFFSSDQSTEKAIYHCSIDNINKNGTAMLKLRIPIDKMVEFGNTSSDGETRVAFVYVLVNMPASAALPADDAATIEALKKIEVATDDFTKGVAPDNFAMRGSGSVTIEGEGKDAIIKGCVPVERIASKVRLFVNLQPKIYLDEAGKIIPKQEGETDEHYYNNRPEGTVEEWTPVPDINNTDGTTQSNTWLFMNNFTTNALTDGSLPSELIYKSTERTTGSGTKARRMEKDRQLADYTNQGDGRMIAREKYPYTHELAYYSYPNEWNGNNILEDNASSLTMRLSWERTWDSETNGKTQLFGQFYYQIPINRVAGTSGKKNDCLEPNTYYRIKVDIGMLGSKDLGKPLEISASYEALPWRNEAVDVDIKGRRYLVVNETEWTMNNTSSISIPFSSSHPVDKVYCYVTYFRYNEIWGTDYESEIYNYPTNSETYNPANWTGIIEHNSDEFSTWLGKANEAGYVGKHDSEGLLSAKVDSDLPNFERILYYKDNYFYDPVYARLNRKDDLASWAPVGYKYYVGHEKPFTFQEKYISKPTEGLTTTMQEGWDIFEKTYESDKIYTCKVDNNTHLITFSHPLVLWNEYINDGKFLYYPELKNSKLRDQFSRIEISIKIQHADWKENDMFSEIIHITQYPGLYIEVSHDYGNPRYQGNSSHTQNDTYNEYITVNGHHSKINRGTYQWNNVNDAQMYSFARSNCNPNMYVIHTTQLSEDNPNYIIGDPRSLYYNCMLTGYEGKTSAIPGDNNRYNLFINSTENVPLGWEVGQLFPHYGERFNWIGYGVMIAGLAPWYYYANIAYAQNVSQSGWQSSPKVQMQRYYPADEADGSGSKIDFVAPTFRIASSFGKVRVNYLEPSRRRCAVYQEAGRPAGRWRLPTKSEIEYIARLSADGKIPILFGNSKDPEDKGTYWSANGKVDVSTYAGTVIFPGEGGASDYAARCVYDDWYWDVIDAKAGYIPDPLDTIFHWGDMDKDFTQPTSKFFIRR